MSHALRNGVIKQNPFDLLEKLEFSSTAETTSQQKKRTYLTIEQQQTLLQSIDNYNCSYHKPMMLILYYMGLRTGDVVSLECTHIIDTLFTQNITKVLEKTRRKIITPCVMPMPKPVTITLREWKHEGATGLVFPNSDGGRLSTGIDSTYQSIQRIGKRILRIAPAFIVEQFIVFHAQIFQKIHAQLTG